MSKTSESARLELLKLAVEVAGRGIDPAAVHNAYEELVKAFRGPVRLGYSGRFEIVEDPQGLSLHLRSQSDPK